MRQSGLGAGNSTTCPVPHLQLLHSKPTDRRIHTHASKPSHSFMQTACEQVMRHNTPQDAYGAGATVLAYLRTILSQPRARESRRIPVENKVRRVFGGRGERVQSRCDKAMCARTDTCICTQIYACVRACVRAHACKHTIGVS